MQETIQNDETLVAAQVEYMDLLAKGTEVYLIPVTFMGFQTYAIGVESIRSQEAFRPVMLYMTQAMFDVCIPEVPGSRQ